MNFYCDIFFNSFYNLNEAMTKGVESDTEKMVFHFIKHDDVEKVKYLIKSKFLKSNTYSIHNLHKCRKTNNS